MTSLIHKRISSITAGVAIALLLVFIIVLWLQVGHGAFRPKQHYNITMTFSENEQRTKPVAFIERLKQKGKNFDFVFFLNLILSMLHSGICDLKML